MKGRSTPSKQSQVLLWVVRVNLTLDLALKFFIESRIDSSDPTTTQFLRNLIAEDMSHVDVAAAPDRDRGFWLHLDLKGAPPTVDYLTSLLTWLRDAMPIMAEFDHLLVCKWHLFVALWSNFVISAMSSLSLPSIRRAAVSSFAPLEGLLVEYEDQFPYSEEIILRRPPG